MGAQSKLPSHLAPLVLTMLRLDFHVRHAVLQSQSNATDDICHILGARPHPCHAPSNASRGRAEARRPRHAPPQPLDAQAPRRPHGTAAVRRRPQSRCQDVNKAWKLSHRRPSQPVAPSLMPSPESWRVGGHGAFRSLGWSGKIRSYEHHGRRLPARGIAYSTSHINRPWMLANTSY